jgi:membrane-associated protein
MNPIDLLRHTREFLETFISQYHSLVYILLFAIIFTETGLVIMPFLPGDSLLFAVGALSANPAMGLNPLLTAVILFVAALCGDTLNYTVGKFFGERLFNGNSKLLKREYLTKTEGFFAKYGGQAIIRARFVPLVRTFAPFTAGMGKMPFPQFFSYSVAGAILWVGVCMGAGYFFGNFPIVQKRFELFALGIVVLSILPVVYEVIKHRQESKKAESVAPVGPTATDK